ncbi:MAG: excinuclease ABC subunit B [Candidatus Levybacteria bacterium RIFCSPHIGHO2_01_FULL_40_10]|nr:MAG: excinuclease ABC subunit B [Candidatus Levybacteria bacterium RIFCSPHIGHO2_01_FULL_40_10]
MDFKLESKFKPTGDQPEAIEKLVSGLKNKAPFQVLLGVTGSGKTFTMSNVIQRLNVPTLIMTHNKTLAAQLYQEFRDFFPKNAVSYFVSYYDYYQPEAYIPTTDTYIAKETEINEEIDKLRLAATTNILTRNDTIVVASVSAIYNLGSPVEYGKISLEIAEGVKLSRNSILDRLLDLQYGRNDYAFKRSTFRVRGETIEVYQASEDKVLRITLEGEHVLKIDKVDPINGNVIENVKWVTIYPAKHYITNRNVYEDAFSEMRKDLVLRVGELKKDNKLLEADRLQKRTEYDMKMIKQIGYVNGIENYSRYFDGRKPGEPPYTLLEYFAHTGKPWLLVIDESHMTIPQIHGMYNGDFARKKMLVDYGFRLPSAYDNRPLKYEEFMMRIKQTIFASATPNQYEMELAGEENIAEQLIRPTGVVDPDVDIRPTEGQVDDLIGEIRKRVEKKERVLVTTLTKRMAEDLAFYLEDQGLKVQYLHSEIDTFQRQDILDELRNGKYDVLVGINLLREGLDLPEVSLVAIMDADKEGFLRSRTSLIQIMGRAARRVDSKVILYADDNTRSMKAAVEEVDRRRENQLAYNKKHGITPKSVEKIIRERLVKKKDVLEDLKPLMEKEVLLPDDREKLIKKLRKEMMESAKELDFETAALLRDKIRYLREQK